MLGPTEVWGKRKQEKSVTAEPIFIYSNLIKKYSAL